MKRRDFLRLAACGLGFGATEPGSRTVVGPESRAFPPTLGGRTGLGRPGQLGQRRQLESQIRIDATLQPDAFGSSTGDDGRYHALVHEAGGAASKALLTTPASDREIAARIRELGGDDGGGVPMSAWTYRHIPLVPWPNARVQGTPVSIRVEWEGWDRPREISELLRDPGGRGVYFRFGGNEEHDDEWKSGCIACLYSCPGGVVSNERYTIRDRIQEVTMFAPADDLPPDGTRVVVALEILSNTS